MITICVTTFNRVDETIKSFSAVLDNSRVSEIIICDDHSEEKLFTQLRDKVEALNSSKIKLFRNKDNKGAFLNKVNAIERASNDWVALIDSDNEINESYIDHLPRDPEDNVFYLPVRSICSSRHLNYEAYAGQSLDKETFMRIMPAAPVTNAGNYFFNKNTYLGALKAEGDQVINPYGLCSVYPLWLCYKHIDNFKAKVIPGLVYNHGLGADSWYLANTNRVEEVTSFLKNNMHMRNSLIFERPIALKTERMAGQGAYLRDGYQVNYLFGLDDLCKDFLSKGHTVLELGSNDGVSTKLFAQYAKKVTAVDLVLTSKLGDLLSASDNIEFHQCSFNDFYAANKEEYDLIYIDGMHDYDNVKQDIALAKKAIKPGGVICGHDHHSGTGVPRAVSEMFGHSNIKIYSDSSWAITCGEEMKREDFARIVEPYTMTTIERINALYDSLDYIRLNNIPGDLVECGVWKGGNILGMMSYLDHYNMNDRTVWLYDTFSGMTTPEDVDIDLYGNKAASILDRAVVKCESTLNEVQRNLALSNFPNVKFVIGDVVETLNNENNVPKQIALLRLDTDWYRSTKKELDILYPRLSANGVLIVDDYGHWRGAKKAVDDYFQTLKLEQIDYTCVKIIKPNK